VSDVLHLLPERPASFCSLCETEPALGHCAQCQLYFCTGCNAKIHHSADSAQEMRYHTVVSQREGGSPTGKKQVTRTRSRRKNSITDLLGLTSAPRNTLGVRLSRTLRHLVAITFRLLVDNCKPHHLLHTLTRYTGWREKRRAETAASVTDGLPTWRARSAPNNGECTMARSGTMAVSDISVFYS
jgi:hypothetical protein